MYLAKYLLSIEEFLDAENGEALYARAFSRVDETRRQKARRMKSDKARAASLGAGLLLQLAVREAVAGMDALSGRECTGHGPEGKRNTPECQDFPVKRYTVKKILENLRDKPPQPFAYRYGEEGKPYFRDLPFYFNLSHSGEYVLCVIASEEIGADIQQYRSGNYGIDSVRGERDYHGQDDFQRKSDYMGRLAGRFFSERECAALEQAGGERERLFYRLWARKEAYGKLTGKGVAGVLDVDMLPGAAGRESLLWEEYEGVKGYSIAVCRYG